MFGSYAFGAGYFGQGPDFATVIVAVEQPTVVELFGSYSRIVDLQGSAHGPVDLDGTFFNVVDVDGSVE